jgi:2-acylglycerol O-acyltransferase 2
MPAIQFAPLNVPLHRRRQTAALLLWVALLPLCLFIFFYLSTYPSWWPFLLIYLIYLYYDVAPEHGGRKIDWVRRWRIFRWLADYFPITIKKTEELDPTRNYVFGYHPHGIISFGALVNFGTEANHISKVFPGLNIRLLTLSSNFNLPIYRDLLLSLNICSVSRKSCERILKSGPGNALTIVVGGAAESLSAHPGTMKLTINRRMGFVRVAIRTG